MNPKIDELLARIHELESELEADLVRKSDEFRYHFENRRVRFEQDILALHRRLRTGTLRYIFTAKFRNLLTAPIIYGAIFPLLLLDFAVTVYQWICFPVYRIPRVPRGEFFVFDRGLLPYLNWVERLNCFYCSYGNGLMAYAREIIARTEQFWCPIKHARRQRDAHEAYQKFVDYGDAEGYRSELARLRRDYPSDG